MQNIPSRDEVLHQIQQRTAQLLMLPVEQIQPTSRLREDLEADSLFITQLIMNLEDDFGIEGDEADSDHFITINSATDYVMQKLGAA